jgi:mono/diheme cytochrome c family protein
MREAGNFFYIEIPMKIRPVLALVALLFATGCGDSAKKEYGDASKPYAAAALDQKWSKETAEHFWWTSQGSQIVPYDWFLALEMPDSQELFSGDAHFERLRYITVTEKSAKNPGGLPIGFVKNQKKVDGLDILGMSCSACHTAKWIINGVAVQVEGGPAMGDTQTFLEELVASMTQTIDQPGKFDRFAKRVGSDATTLKAGTVRWRDRLGARLTRNPLPADNRPGFGRVDAFGNIINEVTAGDLGIAENARPTDAPVSYPHVWDAPQHDVVQWNGSIPNAGAGPALRNIGEVLGVFGAVAIEPQKAKLPKYPTTTIETKNLNAIEQDLWALCSPRWPENLVPIDKALAAVGKPLYEQHCAACHLPIDRISPARRIVAQMKNVGTDDTLNRTVLRTVKTGVLKGTPKMLNPDIVFGEENPAVEVLMNVTFGAYLAHASDFKIVELIGLNTAKKTGQLLQLGDLLEALQADTKKAVEDYQGTAKFVKQAYKLSGNQPTSFSNEYKARPHNGIWATGPFLHNGSVPTLAELLKKDTERVKEFYVGSWTFDATNVGITSVSEEGGVKHFLFKTTLKGNSNAGHNFGTNLTPEQKKQLIEYVKTL